MSGNYKPALKKSLILVAEHMGYKYYPTHSPSPVFRKDGVVYLPSCIFEKYNSLDGLVPVWEKLNASHYSCTTEIYTANDVGYFNFSLHMGGIKMEVFNGIGLTPQDAAVFTAARAIEALENER